MKNTCITIVLKFHSSNTLQRKDIVHLLSKVAKQWKLQSNGHLTYHTWGKYEIYCGLSPQCHLMNSKKIALEEFTFQTGHALLFSYNHQGVFC